jgi:hypothetical protein
LLTYSGDRAIILCDNCRLQLPVIWFVLPRYYSADRTDEDNQPRRLSDKVRTLYNGVQNNAAGIGLNLKMIHVYWAEHVPEDDSCIYGSTCA